MNGATPIRSAIILYGTETGTAQDIASEVSRTLERFQFVTDVLPFEVVPFSALHQYTLTVFVIATTGQGDFPANSRKFWRSLLPRKLGRVLEGVEYALGGFGR